MEQRALGRTGIALSVIGFGAFKIGRNEGIKYPRGYALPSENEAVEITRAMLDLGINYIDTAPAYGLSEARIGRAIAGRDDLFVSTKVGETFEHGRSTHDFSADGVRASVERSCARLGREALDLVFIHSDGDDERIMNDTDCVPTLQRLRDAGRVRHIGLSGKTVAGARAALAWADAIMVPYHLEDRSHEQVIAEAGAAGVGVVVKKGLASGHLDAASAVRFVLDNPHVTSMVIGGLNRAHMRANVNAARRTT